MNVIYFDWQAFKYRLDEVIDNAYATSGIDRIELSPMEWQRAKMYLSCTTDVGDARMWYRNVLLVPAWRPES